MRRAAREAGSTGETMRAKAEALLASLEIDDLAVDQIVGALTVGMRQRVEILRALSHDARLLIMDEPTAALTEADVTRLFDIVRRLKARGVGDHLHQPSARRDFRASPIASRCCATAPMSAADRSPKPTPPSWCR